MTSLLTHTVAHSSRPSYRPKINNQPLKKFLSLAVSWVKVVKNCKILTFKVDFLSQKLSKSSKMRSNFWRLLLTWSQDSNFLRGWLLVLGLKECLVECATLCVKSEVILVLVSTYRPNVKRSYLKRCSWFHSLLTGVSSLFVRIWMNFSHLTQRRILNGCEHKNS